MIEDRFAEALRTISYHPTPFVYAWKRKNLEKLMEEIMMWDVAILAVEIWLVQDQVNYLIPMRNGVIKSFQWKIKTKLGEEWSDFVDRSVKETMEMVDNLNLEREVQRSKKERIWYHFEFAEKN